MTGLQSKNNFLFERQFLHLACLVGLLVLVYFSSHLPEFSNGSFLGLSTMFWAMLAIGDAIAHQVYVWLCWRLELIDQSLTRHLGHRAFRLYQIGFAILFVLRPVLAFALGWSNRHSLQIDPWIGYITAAALLIPSLYLFYSVKRYFSFERAFGIDHFDTAFRNLPLVRQGIFAVTPNAMYVFGFCMLWVPAFLFQSVAALIVAGFSHLYIWVHYYCTEKPDMHRIYG